MDLFTQWWFYLALVIGLAVMVLTLAPAILAARISEQRRRAGIG
jgi:hypothetical protein